jgi:hypothetical protein
MAWTTEQVLAIAPDASSAKSGKDLSAPRKWKTLGLDQTCAWGTIQGSGKNPYQTCIDFGGPAFKCTCPSRKFPCKHGVGLFLIVAQQAGTMAEKEPPGWVAEWMAKRAEKEEKKAAGAAPPETPPDPEAAAKAAAAAEKRVASREAKVTSGLEELGVWLDDLVRSGFATLPGKPSNFWTNPAARLMDAQAPGLARRISALDGITSTGERWPAQMLRQTALIHLAREGWSRIAFVPEIVQADLRSTIGFTSNQENVLAQPGVRDRWIVAGQRIEEDERLRTQRTWLFGTSTRRPALCLSFSAGPSQPLDISLVPGTTVDAELVFFPSAWPLRALVKERHGSPQSILPALPHQSIAAANAFAAEALLANPWVERVPFAVAVVTPLHRAQGWLIRDQDGDALPLAISDAKAWVLYSLSGGNPISLAGEWDGEDLTPLSVWAEGRFLRI